jgi:hypothetical protein
MIEKSISKGIIKFKSPSVLELVSIQSRLFKEVDFINNNTTADECAVQLVVILKKHFDFSLLNGIRNFEEAENDEECVEFMLTCSVDVLSKIGDVIKKKTQLKTHITPTREESKEMN